MRSIFRIFGGITSNPSIRLISWSIIGGTISQSILNGGNPIWLRHWATSGRQIKAKRLDFLHRIGEVFFYTFNPLIMNFQV